jgi:hypothetical protein
MIILFGLFGLVKPFKYDNDDDKYFLGSFSI